jgi:hypothetical protein
LGPLVFDHLTNNVFHALFCFQEQQSLRPLVKKPRPGFERRRLRSAFLFNMSSSSPKTPPPLLPPPTSSSPGSSSSRPPRGVGVLADLDLQRRGVRSPLDDDPGRPPPLPQTGGEGEQGSTEFTKLEHENKILVGTFSVTEIRSK